MEKETICFEQFLSAAMALCSTKIDYLDLQRLKDIFFSNPELVKKYEYVGLADLNFLKDIVERKGIMYSLKEGLNLNTDISDKINWDRPCTVEQYLVVVSGKPLFNDMYKVVSRLKCKVVNDGEEIKDPYIEKLHNFYNYHPTLVKYGKRF